MLDDTQKCRRITKWFFFVFTVCVLIFLGIRHIDRMADAVLWAFNLAKPLWIGVILALFLNVPLGFVEGHLFVKASTPRKQKLRRPLAILLSLALVFGIFIGVAVLVLPELANAVSVVASAAMDGLDRLVAMESATDYSKMPFGEQLALLDIDFLQLKNSINQWMTQLGAALMDMATGMLGSAASVVVDAVIGLVFSIYILANKETLKRQLHRLMVVWLPERLCGGIIHVADVCGKNFKLFVAGQTIEAAILGSLCAIGMLILRIPYAPMVGALVGVTALIPYVGALIATLIGAFMILTVNPFKALVFVIFLLALQQVEGNVIYPRVVGGKINLPAMWVLAAITLGGNLAGPMGMLLGVPAAASLYALLKEATDKREKHRGKKRLS